MTQWKITWIFPHFVVMLQIFSRESSCEMSEWFPNQSVNLTTKLPPFQLLSFITPRITSRSMLWFTATAFTLNKNETILLFAGTDSVASDIPTGSAHWMRNSTVISCKLPPAPGQREDAICSELLHLSKPSFLGASMKALPVERPSKSVAVVVCDPHAFSSSQSNHYRYAGECKVYNFLSSSPYRIEHSTLYLPSPTISSMGGYAIDLIHLANSGVALYAGYPSWSPNGLVSSIENILSSKPVISPRRYAGEQFHYGFGIAAFKDTIYVSSPSTNEFSPNVSVMTDKGRSFAPPARDIFSAFGTTLEKVKLKESPNSVLIAAPFTSGSTNQRHPNVGRVYLACPGKPVDYIDGPEENSYFGYSMSTLGDLNGDGNEEFAVGAPFLRRASGGLVFIYSTTSPCSIAKEPWQVLNISKDASSLPALKELREMRHFGYIVQGRADFNSDGTPDILISGSNLAQPIVYSTRRNFRAECSFYTRLGNDGGGALKPLLKGDAIHIVITVKFFDVQLNQVVRYDKIKGNGTLQINPDIRPPSFKRYSMQKFDSSIYSGEVSISTDFILQRDAETMQLTDFPMIVGIRDVYLCDGATDCHQSSISPLIRWDPGCSHKLELREFNCYEDVKACHVDVWINAVDQNGHIIEWGNKSIREITITISFTGNTNGVPFVEVDIQFYGAFSFLEIIQRETKEWREELLDPSHVKLHYTETYFRRNVSFTVHVAVYHDAHQVSSSSIEYRVSSNKGLSDINLSNNKMHTNYSFILIPKLELSMMQEVGAIIDNRTAVKNFYANHRYPIEDIGPEMKHGYRIRNSGSNLLANLTILLHVPVKLARKTDNRNYIIYLLSQVRQLGVSEPDNLLPTIEGSSRKLRGQCSVDSQYLNPLEIIAVSKGERRTFTLDDEDKTMADSSSTVSQRQSYSIQNDRHAPRIQCDQYDQSLKTTPECATFICKLDQLQPHEGVHINFRSRVWANTFVEEQISFVKIFTRIEVILKQIPAGVHVVLNDSKILAQMEVEQGVYFRNVKSTSLSQIPIWPIILGVILGILLLILIIWIFYRCGFFQRKRRFRELPQQRQTSPPPSPNNVALASTSADGNVNEPLIT